MRRTTIFLLALVVFSGSAWAQKDSEALKREEIEDYYKKWLEEDVVYILTEQEKTVFEALTTDEERDHFIEQFWARRDSDPATMANEAREEHYRRIAYANEHFHSGVPGWKTDRGWVYIKWGKPTGIEKHPEGGFYARKHHEGGGFTETYPFEVWFYSHIDGVGQGIELEFVDPSKSNEYHIAMHPDEKDALLNVPGAGLTTGEIFGTTTRLDRIRFRNTVNEIDFVYRRAQVMPFQRLQTLYNLQQAPEIKYKDLEKVVEVRLSYQQFPAELRIDQLQLSNDVALVPLTLYVRNQDLSFSSFSEDVLRAELSVYGRVESVGGKVEYVFEDTIKKDVKKETQKRKIQGITLYQKRLPLEVGRHKLSLVLREESTGKIKTLDRLILIPKRSATDLFSSSVILSPQVRRVPENGSLGDPYVLTQYSVRPVETDEFRVSDAFVQSYFEVYNLQVDQSTMEPDARVEIALDYWDKDGQKSGEAKEIFPFTQIQNEFEFAGDRLLIYKTIPFAGLAPGKYRVRFRISDEVVDKTIEKDVAFTIVG
jgi:GWxTD domain-containing protein